MRATTLCLAAQAGGGVWRVDCLRCQKNIGTFRADGVMSAIRATSSRGGVLCPTCRKNSCSTCGTDGEKNRLYASIDGGMMCWFCLQDKYGQPIAITYD